MFGKISRRYYKSNNLFGKNILILSIMFVIFSVSCIYIGKALVNYSNKLNNENYCGPVEQHLKGIGWTYDSISYIGPTSYQHDIKSALGSYKYQFEYKVYGVKDCSGRVVEGTRYILFHSASYLTINSNTSDLYNFKYGKSVYDFKEKK